MEELVVLGTGNALVRRCYNTCFAILGEQGTFLIDTGGGNRILAQLDAAGIPIGSIHDIFLTHRHIDHVLGVFWMIRIIAQSHGKEYDGECRIYAHHDLIDLLNQIVPAFLDGKQANALGKFIHLIPVQDGESRVICGRVTTFFDIHSTKAKQFGFTTRLSTGGKLSCLGDEPFNENNRDMVAGSDWLLSEAFCLFGEADRFQPYKKHHSTVKEASILAEEMGIPHLVLWHTEETHLEQRKELYSNEARQYYSGDVYVPDDLDRIPLQ